MIFKRNWPLIGDCHALTKRGRPLLTRPNQNIFKGLTNTAFGPPRLGRKPWKEALETDKEDGNHPWEEALKQEMENSQVAFQACDGDIKDQIGFKQTTCHLTFVTKLSEHFTRKARFAADGQNPRNASGSQTAKEVNQWN